MQSTGRESTKLQQLNEHNMHGPRHETTLTSKPCATESRDLIYISSRIVHSAASRPKQSSSENERCSYGMSLWLFVEIAFT